MIVHLIRCNDKSVHKQMIIHLIRCNDKCELTELE